ncbi:UNVERIFIED_CONTAM: hypothetical protein HDU68_004308 [Siphonaria sp. JEL0065]|nr:hypothetical protein HDU68_004308 [Siphonaria sp. JEL0065]
MKGDCRPPNNSNAAASGSTVTTNMTEEVKLDPKKWKKKQRRPSVSESEMEPRTSKRARTTTHSYKEVKEHQRSDFMQTVDFESFHGFIENEMDALVAVEGTIHDKGRFPPFLGNSEDMASVRIRSGTVIVIPENGPSVKRWRVSFVLIL